MERAKDVAGDSRLKALQEIQKNTNDWLRFSEAKNAALLTANVAVLGVIANKWPFIAEAEDFTIVVITFSSALLYTSAVLCFISFAPQVWMHALLKEKRTPTSSEDNLLFFGHAKKYEALEWLENLFGVSDFTTVEKLTAQQIVVNSKIASKKYAYFDYAVLFSTAAFVVPAIMSIIMFTKKALLN